jgi:signal transduction histidine kinase
LGELVRFSGLMLVWLLTAFMSAAVAEPQSRSVFIIDESDPSSGAPTTFSSTLRMTLNSVTPHVAVYGETLDLGRFTGPRHDDILRGYLQEKYRDVRFGVVIAVGLSAFELVKSFRPELWPGVPVVFAAIDEMSAARLKLDSDMTGIIMHRTINSMLSAARLLVPGLKGIAILGGSLERDAYRRQYLEELPALAAEIELTNLTGLPLAEQATRASQLPAKTAILYTSLFIDDAGTIYSSADALSAIAKVANRPIVIDVDTLVGRGATGGFVLNNVSYGREVASLTLRIIDGIDAAKIPAAVSEFTRPVFDWRQLKRWEINEETLPGSSEFRFREATAWEQYRAQIMIGLAMLLLQSGVISGLLFERRRRLASELVSSSRLTEIIRLNRVTTVEAISTSIAHELKQPLGAIMMNAQAAQHLLRADPPDVDRLQEILSDILSADQRADEIITHLRQLLKSKPELVLQEFDLNEVIRGAQHILESDAEKRGIAIKAELVHYALPMRADPVHLRQVILNLAMNAMDAMMNCASGERQMTFRSAPVGETGVMVTVSDTGPGISEDKLKSIFDPFVTSKDHGTGLGLSIARTIVEAYGGKIWAENALGGGAIFRFTLSLAEVKNRDRSVNALSRVTRPLTSAQQKGPDPLASLKPLDAAPAERTTTANTAEGGSPADFGKLIGEETAKWGKVVKLSSAKPD